MQPTVNVAVTTNEDGWTCKVRIADKGRTLSEHEVKVTREDKDRFAPHSTVEELVTRSFEFLLEREPPTSILRTFDLPDIERYFPDYSRAIGEP